MTAEEKIAVFESAMTDGMVSGDRTTLLSEVYRLLLDMYVWTREGGVWYDPDYPGFSERVDIALKAYEDIFLPKKTRPMPSFTKRGS